jgi:hypothetical protein
MRFFSIVLFTLIAGVIAAPVPVADLEVDAYAPRFPY